MHCLDSDAIQKQHMIEWKRLHALACDSVGWCGWVGGWVGEWAGAWQPDRFHFEVETNGALDAVGERGGKGEEAKTTVACA